MKRFFVLCLTFLLFSCGPSQKEFDKLKSENSELKQQNAELCKEVENYRNTPDKLYVEVQRCVNAKDSDGLSAVVKKLQTYHPTSTECLKAQSELKKLNTEIAQKQAAEKEIRMKAVKKLKKKFDDVSGITWYYNPYYTHYNDSNHTSIYMGKEKEGSPWLRLRMSYYGDEWIFFKNAYLSYDGNTMEIPFNEYKEKESENSGGGVWEWIDVPVNASLLSFLKQMIKGKVVKMRLSGKYTHTKTLTATEINAIKDVLLGYDVLIKGE